MVMVMVMVMMMMMMMIYRVYSAVHLWMTGSCWENLVLILSLEISQALNCYLRPGADINSKKVCLWRKNKILPGIRPYLCHSFTFSKVKKESNLICHCKIWNDSCGCNSLMATFSFYLCDFRLFKSWTCPHLFFCFINRYRARQGSPVSVASWRSFSSVCYSSCFYLMLRETWRNSLHASR